MVVIESNLFYVVRRFPDRKNHIFKFFKGNQNFQVICGDFRRCSQALQRWNESESEVAAARSREYADVLQELELVGRSLIESYFRDHYGGSVLEILRKGKPIVDDVIHMQLHFGDTLLVGGHWDQIRLLQEERSNFIVLDLSAEVQQVAPARRKALLALFLLLCMLLMMASNWVPSVAAVLITATAVQGFYQGMLFIYRTLAKH